jgi:hypothetical protein
VDCASRKDRQAEISKTKPIPSLKQRKKQNTMQNKIAAVKAASESLRDTLSSLDSLEKQEVEMKAEYEKRQAQLAEIPAEALALAGDERQGDRAVNKLLRSRDDVQSRLDLLPIIRARKQGTADLMRGQSRVATNALIRHCQGLASERMEEVLAKYVKELLAVCGDDAERAQKAAAGIVEQSEAREWHRTFTYYTHMSDPVQDADALIDSVERFARGELCE